MSTMTRCVMACALALLMPAWADADVALLLGTPYGRNASLNPTGHVAVYLSRVCAQSPTTLRPCGPGELGTVISRYRGVAGVDWMAIPLIPYLYAVERASDVPAFADANEVARLRDAYRRAHLRDWFPDAADGGPAPGNWLQLAGAAYDRRIVAFGVRTSPARDDEFIREWNNRPNTPRYHALFRNCADFAQDVVNFYHPRSIRTNIIADLGLTTPKQIARSLARFGERREELAPFAFAVPQIPGSRPEGPDARGVLESFVKTKKYLVPLIAVQPWLASGFAAGYLTTGRFNPARRASAVFAPADVEAWAAQRDQERAHSSALH